MLKMTHSQSGWYQQVLQNMEGVVYGCNKLAAKLYGGYNEKFRLGYDHYTKIKYSNCSLPPYPFLPSFSYIPIYRGSKNLKYGQIYIQPHRQIDEIEAKDLPAGGLKTETMDIDT